MRRYPWYTNELGDVEDVGLYITWQRGPLDKEINGASPDMVVRALAHKFELWQQNTPCVENAHILNSLNSILANLDKRTRDRARRGVMGTEEP
jgi:hypothetical protein